ncbi:anti-sigma regulatory factor (Ser/Thr protein kinase) [Streptomyces puniciscabiei]|uniref:Anti-sigma regulatory factor (Ser/Thr protein kinase) n=1 Tax=Streptomyces puniciscabiei TaxID=164348 RepID=A0A542TH29_9ACTN|nr:anti-sigma factor RsbA family regulatory protein [Streptomyces puniciscabiei]TQK86151.1 anti-sigma regulatory factor (Ser/Thr protein kinase) [Streptomyces puniciscabiei]
MTGTAPGPQEFVHPALFYSGEQQYVAGTVPFVLEGLAREEPVAVAAPPDRLQLIKDRLGDQARRVHFVDMTQAGRNPGRIIPGVLRRFADAHAGGRVRIIGEPIWPGRSAAEYPACVQHEALINAAFTGRAVTILCPYDVAGLDQEVLKDALATHPVVVAEGSETASAAYSPEEIVARYNQALPVPSAAQATKFEGSGQLPTVREFAVRQGERLGLEGTRLQDLQLAVAELTTNSVVHGAGGGTLRIWAEDKQVVCEVQDAGRLTDPLAGRRPPAPERPGGRGLLLVNHLADLVRIHTSEAGTTIRFYIDR